MQSRKMWIAFAIVALFSGVETLAVAIVTKYALFTPTVSLIVGGVCMLVSVVLSFLREKLPRIAPVAVGLNAVACGAFIGAFAVHKSLADVPALGVCALIAATAFLLFMAICSLPLRAKRWFLILGFFVWASASYFLGAFALQGLYPQLSDDYLLAYLFFLLPVFGLAVGCLLPAETWQELLSAMLTPCTVTVGFVGVIVLLIVSGGDGCDCDCGDLGDCCDCSTDYHTKNKKPTSMSELSQP